MIEDLIADVTPGKAIAWSAVIFVVFLFFYDNSLDRRISRLGAHPPVIRSYLPLGKSLYKEVLFEIIRLIYRRQQNPSLRILLNLRC